MRLDGAVYVLAKPTPPSMPSRRAFVLAGCAFTAGIVTGGACGYSAGVLAGAPPSSADTPPAIDSEHDEFRQVARGPIEELMAVHLPFVNHARSVYADDPVMWEGVARIVDALISGYEVENRRASARWIAQVIEQSNSEHARRLLRSLEALRKIK
jgi:hypothetical protein